MGDPGVKVIYLTFDAGYENGNTAKILDALKKHAFTLPFFVVGNYLETSPELVNGWQKKAISLAIIPTITRYVKDL